MCIVTFTIGTAFGYSISASVGVLVGCAYSIQYTAFDQFQCLLFNEHTFAFLKCWSLVR